MDSLPFAHAILGGIFIGLAAGAVWLFNGRIAGVSGLLADLLPPRNLEFLIRGTFLVGLVIGGTLLALYHPAALPQGTITSLPRLLIGGLLVGFGARLAGGCTSGHGLCGVARLSRRSIVAAALFILAGMFAVLFFGRVGGAS